MINHQYHNCNMASLAITVFCVFLNMLSVLASFETHPFSLCMKQEAHVPQTSINRIVHYQDNSTSFSSLLEFSIQNLRFSSSSPKPLFIITPQLEIEIQASVICCKRYGLQIRIRSGGHDYEGLSYASKKTEPFVIIDLMNFRKIRIDEVDHTAWVDGGATLGELYYKIAETSNSLGFPAGVCSTVGVSGLFSGGGVGTLSRKYGLSIDHVIDAKIVDVNGRVLDRNSMGEDLFWAIRGGGGMSFGVVISWRIKLVPVPQTVTVFTVNKMVKRDAIDLIYRWQQVAPTIHEDLFMRVVILSNRNDAGEPFVMVTFPSLFLGSARDLIPLMDEKLPEMGLKNEDCKEMTWIKSVLHFDLFPDNSSNTVLLDRNNSRKVYFKAKSDFVEKPILKNVWGDLWERLKQETAILILDPHGGKMSSNAEGDLPFPHKPKNIYHIQYLMQWQDKTVEKSKLKWMRELYEFMAPQVSKNPRSAYINYRDLDLGMNVNGNSSYWKNLGWGLKYFKGNFKRLALVKGRLDPENFFRNEQSIPPLPL